MDESVARDAWRHYEPLHDLTYFAPDLRATTDAAGLAGFWMAYYAMRLAPLGAVSAETATAVFYGFHPQRSARALPDAWNRVTPVEAIALREQVVDAAMRAVLGDTAVDSSETAEAAELAWRAAQACDTAGRPLAAANQALPRPTEPHVALWQATTTLREHRGDGHNAVLVARGIGPAQAHLLKAGAGDSEEAMLRDRRGFPAGEWQAARDDLTDCGLLAADGSLTEAGRVEQQAVEQATDRAAMRPWLTLGATDTERLLALLCPLSTAVLESGLIPQPNPVGLIAGPDCRHRAGAA